MDEVTTAWQVVQENLKEDLKGIDKEKPVLLKFWIERCQPCLRINEPVQVLADTYGFEVVHVKADTGADNIRALNQFFRVQSVPRLIMFDREELVFDGVGSNLQALTDYLKNRP